MSQELAETVVRAAQAKARELGITISVAVVDESGHLVSFVRGDTCSFITFDTALGKAVMAAGFRRPTKDYEEACKANPALWASAAQRLDLLTAPGGHPLTRDGVMIGAVGCGGSLGPEDHLCSEAGASAVST